MDFNDAVVIRIKELAEKHNFSLSKWSLKAGITPSTVYDIVNKKAKPKAVTIRRLCDGIKISLPDFYNVDYILSSECEEI